MMKKSYLITLVVLLVSVVFIACKSDKDNDPEGPLAKIEIKQLVGTKADTAFVMLNLYLRKDLKSTLTKAFSATVLYDDASVPYNASIGFLVSQNPQQIGPENAWIMQTDPVFFGAAPLNTIAKSMHAEIDADPFGPTSVETMQQLADYTNTVIAESDGSSTYPVAIWGLEPNTTYYIVPFFKSDTTGIVTGTLPCIATTTQN